MKHRGRNEGSITQRRDGRWQAIISLGYEGGRRKRKSIYGRTRAEVAKELTKLLRTKDRGLPLPAGGTTLERYMERWLEHVKPTVRPRSWESFEMLSRRHIVPELGRYRLEKLTPDHVQDLLNRKLAAGLSAQTVRHIRMTLGLALKRAVKWELAARNVAALTDGPKVERKPISPLSAEEAQRLLAVVHESRLAGVYELVFSLGLRRGECLGLAWPNVDLEARTLTITQSLQRVGGRLQLLPLKTKQSARTIALPERTVAALRRQSVRQKEEQLRSGPEWQGNPDNLVFTSLAGTPLEPRNVSARHFKAMLAKAGIEPHRFNDARHTCATLLLDDGANIKQVQALLGHSRVATTLDVYVHHTPAARDDTAARMDQILSVPAGRK
ncbi:MAG: tyrosine-type recombinase/integrase [Candidatus Binataceae bacterium]